MSSSGADRAIAAAGLVVAVVLLVSGTLAHVASYELAGPSTEGRFREELNIAAVAHLRGRYPAATYPIRPGFFSRDPRAAAFHEALSQAAAQAGIQPWQVWRTVPASALPLDEVHPVFVGDDRGRVLLLASAFRLFGGVTPFLLFWLGLLVLLPVTSWLAVDFERAGHATAGAIFLVLLGASPYVIETLALAYSPVGFHVVGLTVLVALGAHAVLHRQPTLRSMTSRVAGAALALAVCFACRRATVLLIPGFVLVLAIAAWRSSRGRARRLSLALGWTVLLLAPAVLTLSAMRTLVDEEVRPRPSKPRHQPWLNLWEGLGDFDREKGYAWADRKAMQYAIDVAGPLRALGARSERAFRRKVLGDIREDPLWFARIIAQRVAATVLQTKLWPWREIHSFAPATSPNEGAIDSYYGLVSTVDHLGLGPRRWEIPIGLLLGPTLLLGVVVLFRRRGRRGALLLGCVAVAAGTSPVLISTASGIETQSIGLAYFLGAALAFEALFRPASGALEHQEQEDAAQGEGSEQQADDDPEDR